MKRYIFFCCLPLRGGGEASKSNLRARYGMAAVNLESDVDDVVKCVALFYKLGAASEDCIQNKRT